MVATANLFESIPEILQDELLEEIITRPGVAIERIISRGHCSPQDFWYDQTWDEWVLLVRGSAGLEIEGQQTLVSLHPGDHLLIPAGTRHRIAWTDAQNDTIWLAVHIHSRENL